MQKIANEIQDMTGGFKISKHSGRILDFCLAPGGFMEAALRMNPGSSGLAFALPAKDGGWDVLLPWNRPVKLKSLDVTMLAEDMGKSEIPADHPDAANFLPRQLEAESSFDLVICDGQVLRTQMRAAYREARETQRLRSAQLVLGLEQINPGGNMIVLLHRIDRPENIRLLYDFSKFSTMQIIKPTKGHAIKSSFYMVATNVQPEHPAALDVVVRWKSLWEVATFGTDEAFLQASATDVDVVDDVLEHFGSTLIAMGEEVWRIQAEALDRASFMKR